MNCASHAFEVEARSKEVWWYRCVDDKDWQKASECLCSMQKAEAVEMLEGLVGGGCDIYEYADVAEVVSCLVNEDCGASIAASLDDETLSHTLAHCAQETDDYDCSLAHAPDKVLEEVLQP